MPNNETSAASGLRRAGPVIGLAAGCAGIGLLAGVVGGRLLPRHPPALTQQPVAAVLVQPMQPVPTVPAWHDGLERAAPDVRQLAERIRATGDHGGRPFIILDKRQARIYLFDGHTTLVGVAPVLLGLARGDDTVPGIGDRPIKLVRPSERTTPAGRFVSRLGRNAGGEDVLWVDYDAAVSMHRVRATDPAEHRLQRLASPSPKDNRISYGCINLPPKFYEHSVRPMFEQAGGIVYVLPETRPASAVFAALYAAAAG